MERFVYREEPTNEDPKESPVRAILYDRKLGRYNLLDPLQRDTVLEAIEGKVDQERLVASKPFPVLVELSELGGNTKRIELVDFPPENVLSAPITVYFEVSSKCNLRCKDCYQGERDASEKALTSGEIESLLKRFSEFGIFIVRFTGKEPTFHPDILKFIKSGKDQGLKMALNTNGVFENVYASDLVDAGIEEVVVSLDGDAEWNDRVRGKGVYARAVESLRLFSEAGVETRINMTVSKSNMGRIEHVARLAHEIGCYVSYIPMRSLGSASEGMVDELLDPNEMREVVRKVTMLRKVLSPTRLLTYFDVMAEESDYYHPMFQMKPCHARKNIFMTNQGDVYPCDHLVVLGEHFRGGNVKERELPEIWRKGEGLNRYRSLEHNNKCLHCGNFGKKCHGGCPSEALASTRGETTQVKDRLCFL